jgi:hypothetical protein
VSAELHRSYVLDELEREEALGWLAHWPEYRELIRQRVSDEQKRRRLLDARRRWRFSVERIDIDQLGPEIDGCG